LDFPTVLWLEDYLSTYKKTFIVVSHDRKFLDNVCTDVMFLHNKKLTYYKGNFNTFEKVRAEQLRCDWKAYEKQQKEKKENQEFIERYNSFLLCQLLTLEQSIQLLLLAIWMFQFSQ
jgi:ATP-binding cassette subfamily F protein 3